MTVEGLVFVLFNMGRFLIPIILVLALYWYLVRFQVDARDRAALAYSRNRARAHARHRIAVEHTICGQLGG